jgi:hypothetical protein
MRMSFGTMIMWPGCYCNESSWSDVFGRSSTRSCDYIGFLRHRISPSVHSLCYNGSEYANVTHARNGSNRTSGLINTYQSEIYDDVYLTRSRNCYQHIRSVLLLLYGQMSLLLWRSRGQGVNTPEIVRIVCGRVLTPAKMTAVMIFILSEVGTADQRICCVKMLLYRRV